MCAATRQVWALIMWIKKPSHSWAMPWNREVSICNVLCQGHKEVTNKNGDKNLLLELLKFSPNLPYFSSLNKEGVCSLWWKFSVVNFFFFHSASTKAKQASTFNISILKERQAVVFSPWGLPFEEPQHYSMGSSLPRCSGLRLCFMSQEWVQHSPLSIAFSSCQASPHLSCLKKMIVELYWHFSMCFTKKDFSEYQIGYFDPAFH